MSLDAARPRRPAARRRPAAVPSKGRAAAVKPARVRQSSPVDRRILERRRKVAAEHARRRRRLIMSVLCLVLLAASAYGVSRTPLFAVGEVRVTGLPASQVEQVLAVADIATGGNVLDVDTGEVERRVENLPWVRDARVRRLPGTVEIHVVPRVAVAGVRVGGAAWLVDGDGWVMGGGADPTLVVIDAPDAVLPPVGERISHVGIRNALAVHAALPDTLRAVVDRYDASGDRALRLRLRAPGAQGPRTGQVATPGGPQGIWVRFGVAERIEEKARVIELLLGQAREQAAHAGTPVPDSELPPGIAELDVRAPDNPVIIPAA